MKYLKLFALALMLISVGMPPSVTFAATTTPSWWGFTSEGSSETGTTRQQRLRGYRQQSSEFQQKIAALPAVADIAVPMPVLFGVGLKNISPNFGDPRDGGARTHEGEDILAVKGTPIVSPTAAVVLRTVTGPDEGNAVYTANPGGETFVYMHLDHFGEGVVAGTVLAPGGLIGYVGDTGNAAGGPAHLHFEIHNNSGAPTDPFPRLTREFTYQEKISYLSVILTQSADPRALAQFLVSNFRATFKDALASNVSVPSLILEYMASMPEALRAAGSVSLPAGDLDIGSSGVEVTNLQKYLIAKASGPAATRLASAGATGYFGAVTQSALIEFQKVAGITPATGYFGPATRAVVGTLSSSVSTPSVPSGTVSPKTLTRDLSLGMSGEDVRTLQKMLNHYGIIIAASDSGSPGNETIYFGPATKAAVITFQTEHHITPSEGYVGPITRTALNALI